MAVIHVLLYKMELCFFSLRLHIHIQTFFFIWISVTVVPSSKAIPSVIEKYPYKKGAISWGVLSQWEVPSLEGCYLSERCHLLRGATSVRGAISWGVLSQCIRNLTLIRRVAFGGRDLKRGGLLHHYYYYYYLGVFWG